MGTTSQKLPTQQQFQSGVEQLLPHTSINPDAKITVLVPYLSTYHVLIPDQICHGQARNVQPFTLDFAAETIAQLIKQRAHSGIAHVASHSLGASVALRLAAKYPELVSSMVVSGICRLPRTRLTPYLPYVLWLNQRLEYAVPPSVTRWLMDGADIRNADLSLCTLALNRQIFGDCLSTDEWPEAWSARTLIIAATKKGILPTDDNVGVAKKVAELGHRLNSETFAVTHAGMRHPWNRQDPELFAGVIKAWIEQTEELPIGFQRCVSEE